MTEKRGFNLDDYVDVAERIRQFNAKYPDGSLQSELVYMGEPAGWLCSAFAYRGPDDARPGVGHAFEPVPGKTPYTRDSEAQNAETAAWGRAIVALGFETKKIASREEIKAREVPRFKAPAGVYVKASVDSIRELQKLAKGQSWENATIQLIEKKEEEETLTQEWVDRQIATSKENLAKKALV